MKYLIYIIAIIILIGLNLGLFGNLQIYSQLPNLALLFTVCAALDKKNEELFFIAFTCGVLLDFYSTSFFGTFTVSFLLLALVLKFLTNTFVVLELNWKSLSLLLLGALLLLNIFSWTYGFIAYKFHWVEDYNSLKTFRTAFLVLYLYDLVLIFPAFIYYNFVRQIIDGLSIRKRI